MYRSIARLAVGLSPLIVSACSDRTLVGIEPTEAAYADLGLRAPLLTAADLVVENFRQREPDAAAVVGASTGSEGEEDGEEEPSAEIFDPSTKAGFFTGEAYAEGSQKYNGNVGRVETTVDVFSGTERLGSYTAAEQESVWFPFHLGQIEFMFAYAPVYTEAECGLTVRGSSRHRSWFEFFSGVGAPRWGETETSSTAQPASQPECEEVESETSLEGGGSAGDVICLVRIWYDTRTGEVLGIEILSCWQEEA